MPLTQLSDASGPERSWRTAATMVCGALLLTAAVLLRLNALPFISSDMRMHLLPWYMLGSNVLRSNFADYTPPYLYLLIGAAQLHPWLPPVLAIKGIALIFDGVIAVVTYLIVRSYGRGPRYAALGALAILLLPTVWMNSARWGQCDAIHTSFILACVYACLRRQPFAAMLWFSVALCFKLQAVFIVPFLIVEEWRYGGLRRYWWLPIAAYLVAALPALYVGRSFQDLLLIYPRQMQLYTDLSMWAPSMWGIGYLTADTVRSLSTGGVIWVIAVVNGILLATVFVLVRRGHDVLRTPGSTLLTATASVLIVPFLLPRMHDRYFFVADVLSFILVLCEPRFWYVAAGIQAASLTAYGSLMLGWPIMVVGIGTIVNAACIGAVLWHLAIDRRAPDAAAP